MRISLLLRPADRIAATLQLLTFFFISVFAFNPHTFCVDAKNNGYDYACDWDQGERARHWSSWKGAGCAPGDAHKRCSPARRPVLMVGCGPPCMHPRLQQAGRSWDAQPL